MKKIILMLLPLMMLLAGCSTTGGNSLTAEEVALYTAALNQPTLSATCIPPNSCEGMSIVYRDPRDRLQINRGTNANDVWMNVINKAAAFATGAAPLWAIGKVAHEGFKAAGQNTTITGSGNTDQYSVADSNNTTTTSTETVTTSTTTDTNTETTTTDYGGATP